MAIFSTVLGAVDALLGAVAALLGAVAALLIKYTACVKYLIKNRKIVG
jgi:hypothetical protein